MADDLDKQIEEHLEKLPKATRRALQEFDWTTKLQELGKRHGLMIDELAALQTETTLVLAGVSLPESYQLNLRKNMNVSDKLAEAIVKDVNVTIFQPLHEMVMNYNKDELTEHGEIFNTPKETPSTPNEGETPLKRREVLAGIEDVEKTEEPKNVAKLKLADLFTKKPEKTDHTVAPKKSGYESGLDPYHEPID